MKEGIAETALTISGGEGPEVDLIKSIPSPPSEPQEWHVAGSTIYEGSTPVGVAIGSLNAFDIVAAHNATIESLRRDLEEVKAQRDDWMQQANFREQISPSEQPEDVTIFGRTLEEIKEENKK